MELFIQILATVSAIVAVTGVVINLYKDKPWWRWCFKLWLFSNACSCVIMIQRQVYAYIPLRAIYFGIAVWGVWKWRKK